LARLKDAIRAGIDAAKLRNGSEGYDFWVGMDHFKYSQNVGFNNLSYTTRG